MALDEAKTEELQEQLAQTYKLRSLWGDAFRRLLRNRLSLIGFVIFCGLFIAAAIGPYIAPYPYMLQDLDHVAELPSAKYWLGTDDLGRDLLSRILWGARTAGIVAISSTVMNLIIGIVLGAMGAYLGGWVDWLISRAMDVIMSVPSVLFLSLIASVVRHPIANFADQMYERTQWGLFATTTYLDMVVVFGALAVIYWPGYARMIRGQILALRQKEFVEAANMIGARRGHILLRHLIPNALGPIVVTLTMGLGGAITAESGLSALGVGVKPPQASWGNMIADNAMSWRYRPWLVAVPGLTIAIVSLGIAFLGDGLNDALNPRQADKG